MEGVVLNPSRPAPALALRSYTGQPVNLSAFRGKVVLVTFVYTHCRDVCPLIVSNLAAARRQLAGEAAHFEIIAVTVDPTNDTPAAVRQFLAARNATGRMDYLIGSRQELLPVWKAWGIAISVNRYEDTESHTALVCGINPAGRLAVVYPSDFTPGEMVHDLPLLARS